MLTTPKQAGDLVDPTDFCRSCRGTGRETFPAICGGYVPSSEPCPYCRGGRVRTVRLTEVAA